jgi:hypothetical protein
MKKILSVLIVVFALVITPAFSYSIAATGGPEIPGGDDGGGSGGGDGAKKEVKTDG